MIISVCPFRFSTLVINNPSSHYWEKEAHSNHIVSQVATLSQPHFDMDDLKIHISYISNSIFKLGSDLGRAYKYVILKVAYYYEY